MAKKLSIMFKSGRMISLGIKEENVEQLLNIFYPLPAGPTPGIVGPPVGEVSPTARPMADIRDLLEPPKASETDHIFVRPDEIEFLAVEDVPNIAVPMKPQIHRPN